MAGAENVLVYTIIVSGRFANYGDGDGSTQRYYYDPISKPLNIQVLHYLKWNYQNLMI